MKQVQRQFNRTDGQQGFNDYSLGNVLNKTTRRMERRMTMTRPSESNGSGISTDERSTGKQKGTETDSKECILRIATKTKRLAEEPNLNTKGERTCLYLHEWLFANYGVHALPVRAPLTKHLPFQGTQVEQGR